MTSWTRKGKRKKNTSVMFQHKFHPQTFSKHNRWCRVWCANKIQRYFVGKSCLSLLFRFMISFASTKHPVALYPSIILRAKAFFNCSMQPYRHQSQTRHRRTKTSCITGMTYILCSCFLLFQFWLAADVVHFYVTICLES